MLPLLNSMASKYKLDIFISSSRDTSSSGARASEYAAGGTAMAVCNAANEVAVAAFLAGDIQFTAIPRVIEQTLTEMPVLEPNSLDVVESADAGARLVAQEQVATLYPGNRIMGLS